MPIITTSSRVDKNKYNQKRGRTNSIFGNSTALAPFGVESMLEIWKDLPEYEGCYMVSNLGRVKSLDRVIINRGSESSIKGRVLSQRKNKYGYMEVHLSKFGKSKLVHAHVLVAVTFLNHKQTGRGGLCVDHIDNDSSNNKLKNLQVISYRENLSKDKKGGSSKYVGVSWNKFNKKWLARIGVKEKRINIGYFKKEIDAHKAYNKALSKINNGEMIIMSKNCHNCKHLEWIDGEDWGLSGYCCNKRGYATEGLERNHLFQLESKLYRNKGKKCFEAREKEQKQC